MNYLKNFENPKKPLNYSGIFKFIRNHENNQKQYNSKPGISKNPKYRPRDTKRNC